MLFHLFSYVITIKNERVMKAFGKHLKSIRIAKGLSQERLSILANIPLSQMGRIERGEVNTTISSIYALADALNINAKELFEFNVNPKNRA